MKRIIAIYITLLTVMTAAADETVMSLSSASTVIITENAAGISVQAINEALSDTVVYNRAYPAMTTVRTRQKYNSIPVCGNSHVNFNCISADGLGFGFVNALGAPQSMDLEMGKSFELSCLYLIGFQLNFTPHGNAVSFGLGLDWRNYRTTTGYRFALSPDGDNISWNAYPEGCYPRASRLKVFSLQLPLTYCQPLPVRYPWGGSMELTVGAVACFNTHASIRSSWNDPDGKRVNESSSAIPYRHFTVDAIAMLRLSSFFGVYLRYSPYDVITPGHGPSFRSFSTGISFYL